MATTDSTVTKNKSLSGLEQFTTFNRSNLTATEDVGGDLVSLWLWFESLWRAPRKKEEARHEIRGSGSLSARARLCDRLQSGTAPFFVLFVLFFPLRP